MKSLGLFFTTVFLIAIYSSSTYALVDNTKTDSSIAASSSVPVDRLTVQEVKRLFLGKTTIWQNGTEVKTCYLEDNSFGAEFVKEIIGKTTGTFHSYWTRQLFAGNGTPPEAFTKPEEVVAFLNKNKGSIC